MCVMAEYGMLPRSTHSRMQREAAKGNKGGHCASTAIAALFGAMVDLKALGERAITLESMLFKQMAAHVLHPLLVLRLHYVITMHI